jgi:hypothetical protein
MKTLIKSAKVYFKSSEYDQKTVDLFIVDGVIENISEQQEASSENPTQELQEAVEDAIANGASEKEVKNLIKEFQLKVNGKVINKTIDLSDENALKNELQLSAAARQAMQEAANLKKLYESEVNRLKQDPFSVLAELGLDLVVESQVAGLHDLVVLEAEAQQHGFLDPLVHRPLAHAFAGGHAQFAHVELADAWPPLPPATSISMPAKACCAGSPSIPRR